ncbi:MAG: sigma 54-interacting transcriptional regulator, partial [Polyangiaceae bacterium]
EGVGPASDLFALGLVLEEILAGEATEPSTWSKLLVLRAPGARPSATWVADRAARLLGLAADPREPIAARVASIDRVHRALRANDREPMSLLARARFWVALVGPAAAAWPVADLPTEHVMVARAKALAEMAAPEAWTLEDVRGARIVAPPSLPSEPAARLATLALELARPRPDPRMIAAVEDDVTAKRAPTVLALALAEALVRRGELGRAWYALSVVEGPSADAARAELARRSGERETAEKWAKCAIVDGDDRAAKDRARATLGRLAWDDGRYDDALALLADASGVAAAEVRALVACSRGAIADGLLAIERADAGSVEDTARLEATRGMLEHAAGRAEAASRSFARAVELAAQAGSVVEEATYLTGLAAAATDEGDVGRALDASMRAALLWERLGRDANAARAWLSRASALATLGATHAADEAADQAAARALASGDRRAAAYARWARVETRAPGDEHARQEAMRAAAELVGASEEDRGRAAARLLVWAPSAIDEAAVFELDRAAQGWTAGARWEWWGMRAAAVDARQRPADARAVAAALTALVGTAASIGSRGPALAAAAALATALGDGEAARRFETERRLAATKLRASTPPAFTSALGGVAWAQEGDAPSVELAPAQIASLETLVRAFGGRDRLRPLFEQALDAMLLWSGVERGLLLLKAPNDRLVPRAARNLAREDLDGEQLALSHGIAREAMRRGEAVVATDAFATLGDLHASVHTLRLRSVLAVPLIARGETLGVVYLDDRTRRGAFGPRELAWVRLIASQAAMAITDARDQVLLRRAARRAERARAELAEVLSRTEAKLDAALVELDASRGEAATRYAYESIVGRSKPMRTMLRVVDRVTASDIPVLLNGESGTGKELVARALHANGLRTKRSFVSENCASVPESLLESTLFGHVKGAFTGASSSRAGLFEIADGGTLFLDEIGEMPLSMQAKLLRVLQDGEVRPVGGDRTRKVDVRIIAATHRDLASMVAAGTFREDLFYRLNVVSITIPALRERPDDVPTLVQFFLAKHAGERKPKLTRAALDRLTAFSWPGNVRQLENEIRRAIVLAPDDHIDVAELSEDVARGGPRGARAGGHDLRSRVDALEAELLRDALEKTGGNQTKAAQMLGLSRFGLQKMMKRLAIAASR